MQMDRNVAKGAAPHRHRRVEVRMGDGDSLQPPERLDQGDGGSIEHRDAIPQHIAIGRRDEERALADRKLWLRADADDARLVLAPGIEMSCRQSLGRRPGLPALGDVLALFLADRATRRRGLARRILRAAGRTDVGFHSVYPLDLAQKAFAVPA